MASYLILFASAFLSATVLPFASEMSLAAAVRIERAVLLPVLIATAGNYLGACTTYLLGRVVVAVARPPSRGEVVALGAVRRFGAPALLLSWVPLVGDAIVALAGVIRVPFGLFTLYTVIGKLARYLVVAWVTIRI